MARPILSQVMQTKISLENKAQVDKTKSTKKASPNPSNVLNAQNDNFIISKSETKAQIINQLAQIRGKFLNDFCIYEFEISKLWKKIIEANTEEEFTWGVFSSQRSDNLLKYFENFNIDANNFANITKIILQIKQYEKMRNVLVHSMVANIVSKRNSELYSVSFQQYPQNIKNEIETTTYSLEELKKANKELSTATRELKTLAAKLTFN